MMSGHALPAPLPPLKVDVICVSPLITILKRVLTGGTNFTVSNTKLKPMKICALLVSSVQVNI